jgi:lysozyme family protein
MADFSEAFVSLMQNEGGYSNNPNDPGGETMWGVTKQVARDNGYTGLMREMPKSTAFEIAQKLYWAPYHLDDVVDQQVAFNVLDAAYNGGHPAEWLQAAAKVKVDGNIGPVTIAAVNAADPDKIIMRFDALRMRYLVKCGGWKSFGAGWMNRIADNLERAAG